MLNFKESQFSVKRSTVVGDKFIKGYKKTYLFLIQLGILVRPSLVDLVTVRCFNEMSSTSSMNNLVKNGRDERKDDRPIKELVVDERDKDMPVRRHESGFTAESHSSMPLWKLIEIFAAETIGTGMLMFFGCMSQIVWKEDTPLHPWQGAVVFAAVVASIIQIFGHISAAHLNPAVTLCFLLLGQITPLMSVVYVLAECIGAVLGFGLLKLITPCDIWDLTTKLVSVNVCSTIPHSSLSDVQSIAVEFLVTSCLILVVCGVTDPRNAHQGSANSLKFAATILALSIAVGPYTGASMNPARSLAPALWNGAWEKHWIYWFAPMLSSFVMTIFYQSMFIRTSTSSTEQIEDLPLTGVKVKSQKEEVKERK